MEPTDTIRLQERVERDKNKERRTDSETKQDDEIIISFSSKNEQDWTNNNKTTISNNTEERSNNAKSNNDNKSVYTLLTFLQFTKYKLIVQSFIRTLACLPIHHSVRKQYCVFTNLTHTVADVSLRIIGTVSSGKVF